MQNKDRILRLATVMVALSVVALDSMTWAQTASPTPAPARAAGPTTGGR